MSCRWRGGGGEAQGRGVASWTVHTSSTGQFDGRGETCEWRELERVPVLPRGGLDGGAGADDGETRPERGGVDRPGQRAWRRNQSR